MIDYLQSIYSVDSGDSGIHEASLAFPPEQMSTNRQDYSAMGGNLTPMQQLMQIKEQKKRMQ